MRHYFPMDCLNALPGPVTLSVSGIARDHPPGRNRNRNRAGRSLTGHRRRRRLWPASFSSILDGSGQPLPGQLDLALPVPTLALCVLGATLERPLVTTTGRTRASPAAQAGALCPAVALTSVAAPADQAQNATPSTQEQTAIRERNQLRLPSAGPSPELQAIMRLAIAPFWERPGADSPVFGPRASVLPGSWIPSTPIAARSHPHSPTQPGGEGF